MANNDKKVRMAFTVGELTDIYGALGSRAGMIKDEAAIRDLRPSEYAPAISAIRAVQDRIFEAVREGDEQPAPAAPQAQPTLVMDPPAPAAEPSITEKLKSAMGS